MPIPATPSSRSSNVLWLDADALTGQTDGQPIVGNWGLFQPGGPTLPEYHATAVAGHAGIRLNKNNVGNGFTSTGSIVASLNAAISGSYTITVVYQAEDFATQYQDIFGQARGGSYNRGQILWSGNRAYHNDNTEQHSGTGVRTAPFYGQTSIYQISFDATTSTMTACQYNGQYYTYSDTTSSVVGGNFYIGGGSISYGGYVAQIVVDNVALSQTQLTSDFSYFRNRYAPTNRLSRNPPSP